jgi:hypothetical protein
MQNIPQARRRRARRTRPLRGERFTAAAGAIDPPAAPYVTTLAPSFEQALPSLAMVPAHYNHEVNGELLYKLCAALTVILQSS